MRPDDTPLGRPRLLRWWFATIVIVSAPFIELMAGTRTAIQGDNHDLHLPIFRWVWQSIRHGESPLWSGWAFAGLNVPGFGQGAIYYPPNILFAFGDTVAAYRWWTMLHLWIAASGAFVWAWKLWGSRLGALVTGIVYGLNGQLVLHLVHVNFTMATVWFPWLLLGVHRIVRDGRARDWLAYVVPLAMIALAGHPQMLWAALVASAVMALFELAGNRRDLRAWARYAVATGIGLGLAAAQLLPQLSFSRTSVRPELTSSEALKATARLADLATLLFPHLEGGGAGVPGLSAWYRGSFSYHEVGNHLGFAAAILAVIGIVANRRNRAVQGLATLTFLSIVLALSQQTPFGWLIFHTVPLADRFRIWPRYLVLANLALSGLAGLGASSVMRSYRRWSRPVVIAAAGATVISLAVTMAGNALVSGGALVMAILLPLVAVALLWAATWWGDRNPTWASVAIVAACALPSLAMSVAAPWRTESLTPTEADAFFDPAAAHWEPFDAPGGIDRYVEQFPLSNGLATVRDWDRIDGYDPLLQGTFARLTGAGYFGGVNGDVFWSGGWVPDVLRVTTLLGRLDLATSGNGWTDSGVTAEHREPVLVRTPRLAEAYVAGLATVEDIDGIERDLADPEADFEGTVRIESDDPAFAAANRAGVAGTVTSGGMDRHGNGSWVVDAERPAVLVVSSGWLDGWTATVNGHEVPVARADGLVLAVPLGEGKNVVELSFTPPGHRLGVAGAGASALALVVVLVYPVARRRRRPTAASPSAG